MTVLTEMQKQAKERSIRDVITVLDGILEDAPKFSGNLEIHVKDGIALKVFARRQYNIFDDS